MRRARENVRNTRHQQTKELAQKTAEACRKKRRVRDYLQSALDRNQIRIRGMNHAESKQKLALSKRRWFNKISKNMQQSVRSGYTYNPLDARRQQTKVVHKIGKTCRKKSIGSGNTYNPLTDRKTNAQRQ